MVCTRQIWTKTMDSFQIRSCLFKGGPVNWNEMRTRKTPLLLSSRFLFLSRLEFDALWLFLRLIRWVVVTLWCEACITTMLFLGSIQRSSLQTSRAPLLCFSWSVLCLETHTILVLFSHLWLTRRFFTTFTAFSENFQNQANSCQEAKAKSPFAALDSSPNRQQDQVER